MEYVKESLLSIYEHKFENIFKNIHFLLQNVEEEYLQTLVLNRGIYLSESIVLHYVPGGGFRCFNTDEPIIGKNPFCALIERRMNKKLYTLINS